MSHLSGKGKSAEENPRKPKGEINTRERIASTVNRLISEQLGVDLNEVTESALILDDLGADSLDGVELVMALEEEFDIERPAEDFENLDTGVLSSDIWP